MDERRPRTEHTVGRSACRLGRAYGYAWFWVDARADNFPLPSILPSPASGLQEAVDQKMISVTHRHAQNATPRSPPPSRRRLPMVIRIVRSNEVFLRSSGFTESRECWEAFASGIVRQCPRADFLGALGSLPCGSYSIYPDGACFVAGRYQ